MKHLIAIAAAALALFAWGATSAQADVLPVQVINQSTEEPCDPNCNVELEGWTSRVVEPPESSFYWSDLCQWQISLSIDENGLYEIYDIQGANSLPYCSTQPCDQVAPFWFGGAEIVGDDALPSDEYSGVVQHCVRTGSSGNQYFTNELEVIDGGSGQLTITLGDEISSTGPGRLEGSWETDESGIDIQPVEQ